MAEIKLRCPRCGCEFETNAINDDNTHTWCPNCWYFINFKSQTKLNNSEIKTIKMFGKNCEAQRIYDNLWDFVDLPIKSKIYNTVEEAIKFNQENNLNENLLNKEVLPKLKQELSKTFNKFDCFIPSLEDIMKWYRNPEDKIKYFDGELENYWTNSNTSVFNTHWFDISSFGEITYDLCQNENGVPCAFYLYDKENK